MLCGLDHISMVLIEICACLLVVQKLLVISADVSISCGRNVPIFFFVRSHRLFFDAFCVSATHQESNWTPNSRHIQSHLAITCTTRTSFGISCALFSSGRDFLLFYAGVLRVYATDVTANRRQIDS